MRRVIIRRRIKVAPVTGKAAGPKLIDNETFKKYNPAVLGLGDIGSPSREVEAIAAVFDLAGFTRFCNQVDPHLAVPVYLSRFLEWLFERVKTGLTEKDYGDSKALWAELPILTKFLGDGALFLWDTQNMSETLIHNIITTLYEISIAYRSEFYPTIRQSVANPPSILRCGIARGRVFSVGNAQDYVGHCINTASRLQKLSLLTFSFPRRGFDAQKYMHESYSQKFIMKTVTVRGVGENEIVWVLNEEFDRLPEEAKELFRDP